MYKPDLKTCEGNHTFVLKLCTLLSLGKLLDSLRRKLKSLLFQIAKPVLLGLSFLNGPVHTLATDVHARIWHFAHPFMVVLGRSFSFVPSWHFICHLLTDEENVVPA